MDTAYYIHHLDPILFQLGPLAVRWYGLAYVGGFVSGILLLRQLARLGISKLPENEVSDFITYCAIFGVMLGGRVGYFLFGYAERSALLEDPLMLFRLWEGGMASHGGVLGIMIYTFWYARRHHIPWTHLGDNLVVAAPIGIFFGRMANFINGELYGRAANGLPWAVKFPQELYPNSAHPSLALDDTTRDQAVQLALQTDEGVRAAPDIQLYDAIITRMRENPELRESLGTFLTPRHPSQLYEAGLEGLVLFAILYAVRRSFKNLPNGVLTGLFFVCYALFRIFAEYFREPDSAMVGAFTKGQFYSLFMVVIGAIFLIRAVFLARAVRGSTP